MVALVQQLIGLLARALGVDDLGVDVRNILRQAVDIGDAGTEFLCDADLQVVELLRGRTHARGRFVNLCQRHGAGSHVGWRIGHI